MADNRFGERGYGENRDQDRYGSRDYADRTYGRQSEDEDRGFLERAGDELRSWFGGSEDERGGREPERGRERGYGRFDEDRGRSRSPRSQAYGGIAGPGEQRDFGRGGLSERERGFGRSQERDSGRSDMGRGSFGQSFAGEHRGSKGGYGREHGTGGFQGDYGSGRSQGGFGGQDDRAGGRQSFSGSRNGGGREEADEDRGGLGYSDMAGNLGGFGNQRFGSSQDDHYLNWRNKQIEQLDRDYQDYCQDCEQRFHSDFDSWRRDREGKSGWMDSEQESGGQSATGMTTGSETGTAGTKSGRSESGSDAGTTGGGTGSAIGGPESGSESASGSEPETSGSGGRRPGGRGRS